MHIWDLFLASDEAIHVEDISKEFNEWIRSEDAQEQIRRIEEEKMEVRQLMQDLSTMDDKSSEFTDIVLYGLLPYYKNKVAKRVSNFPTVMNIKKFLKRYEYDDNDWNEIARRIYSLASRVQLDPDRLGEHIKEFISDKTRTRNIQCGAITPILFCINDAFPLVNSRTIRTYDEFARTFGWNDKVSYKLEDYMESRSKFNRLIAHLGVDSTSDRTIHNIFAWWYDFVRRKEGEDDEIDEKEGVISKVGLEDIQYGQFLRSVDQDRLRKLEPHALRNPERIKITTILQNCQDGTWQLPNFQRYFDWRKTDIRDLLESIFEDFYIGSLLLWETGREDELPMETIPIFGTNPLKSIDQRTDMIILDGQQRITSLYYAIKGVTKTTKKISRTVYFYINFAKFFQGCKENNIEIMEDRLSEEESISKMLFPFYRLENYDKWIDAFEDHLEKQEDREKAKKIRRLMESKLKHFFEGFEIPYIALPPTMDITQVTEIFERLNTRGKVLSTFDILIATLSKYGIDLRKLWDDTEKSFPKLKEYNSKSKMPIYILQSIALTNHNFSHCGRGDLLKMYDTVIEPKNLIFEELWKDMSEWTSTALQKLEGMRDGYGVRKTRDLPYLPTIPILTALLKMMSSKTDKIGCNKKLDMWYWASVFSERYSSGVDAKLTADYREMIDWFDDDSKTAKSVQRFRREFQSTLNLSEIEREGNVVYRGILSLLALKGAPDFGTNLALENARNNDRHHIFPKKKFAKDKNVKSILNVTWLSDETNRKMIGASKPSQYVRKFLQDKYDNNKDKFLKMLEKHYISREGYECMRKNNLDGFTKEREKVLMAEVGRRIGVDIRESKHNVMIAPEKPFSNETAILNTIRECDEYVYWIDKYFSRKGLEWLTQALSENNRVRVVKILVFKDKPGLEKTSKLREEFKNFRKEMKERGIKCELRVLTDLAKDIHDRWIITKDTTYNVPSTDVVARGQYAEIQKDANRPDFERWWDASLDIVDDWNKICA